MQNNLLFIEASAKTASNIEKMFINSASQVYDKVRKGELVLGEDVGADAQGVAALAKIANNKNQKRPEPEDTGCC